MSATVIALATVLVIVIILATVAVALLYVRYRKKASGTRGPSSVLSPMTPGFGMLFVPPSHPASHITPFGTSPQRPIFGKLNYLTTTQFTHIIRSQTTNRGATCG